MLVLVTAAGCGHREEQTRKANTSPNADILDEMNQASAWFHAKKVRPIWVRKLGKGDTVKTIEGTERVKAGDFLCRGEAGDVWPQKAMSLNEKYQPTQEVNAGGWHKYVPRPDSQGVMAAQVQHAFTVHAKWGLLSGKAGDYMVKNFADQDVSYPDDVWIVDQKLFRATYEAVARKP
ncbi:MAG TPA: PGDYG domain-containing protein [Gemmataceae bacterium]|nr:PGDYG domain-containing protein [Gemmataceae bacterium]